MIKADELLKLDRTHHFPAVGNSMLVTRAVSMIP